MAIGSVSLSTCVKQRAGRRPAAQLRRNIPDAVHCTAGQSRPNTKTARCGSSPFQVVIRRPIVAAVNCLSQSPVVSPCEWLRFSGLADIPNKLTEEKCGRRTGQQKQTFPLKRAWIFSNTRDYSLISPMLTISRRRFDSGTRYPQRISIRRPSYRIAFATYSRSGVSATASTSRTPHAVTLEPESQLPELGELGQPG